MREYPVGELKFKPRRKKDRKKDAKQDKELTQLEEMEKKEGKSKLDED